MQRNRQATYNSRTSGGLFDSFSSFGFPGSMFPSIFGRKDPFFSHPHGSLFDSHKISTSSSGNVQPTSKPKGPVIEELDSDAEGESEEEENDVGSAAWANRNPRVEHPEDQGNSNRNPLVEHSENQGNDHGKSANKGDISSSTNQNREETKKPPSRSVSFQRVTYGGINGAYYTATSSRRTGDDGVILEVRKQADRTTGEATHRVSRGIHDKGLLVTRKLDSDGKVDTVQTLQNLNEDELEGFEQAWGGIVDNHFRGWNDTFNFPRISDWGSGRLSPLGEFHGSRNFNGEIQEPASSGRPKKVVTIKIE